MCARTAGDGHHAAAVRRKGQEVVGERTVPAVNVPSDRSRPR